MSKKKTEKKPEIKKSKRQLRCLFTSPELLQIGKQLAEHTADLRGLEEQKKQFMSQFTAKIDEKKAQITFGTNCIIGGCEYREVVCTETLGEPKPSQKRVTRDDTGEIVAVEEMTALEMQRELIPSEPELGELDKEDA